MMRSPLSVHWGIIIAEPLLRFIYIHTFSREFSAFAQVLNQSGSECISWNFHSSEMLLPVYIYDTSTRQELQPPQGKEKRRGSSGDETGSDAAAFCQSLK
ncbi:MAG: hypothetical protein E7554_00015 [Ruminococcaceae bacterium]|nr:hypothetical protein [Oscillospiraceae bacterium]